ECAPDETSRNTPLYQPCRPPFYRYLHGSSIFHSRFFSQSQDFVSFHILLNLLWSNKAVRTDNKKLRKCRIQSGRTGLQQGEYERYISKYHRHGRSACKD